MTILALVVVIIGAVIYFAWPMLQNLPAGGVLNVGDIQTNNNIVTLESYSASSVKMYPDEQTTVSFLIQNNGDHPTEPVVNFYDLGGMRKMELSCGFGTMSQDTKCSFDGDNKLMPFAAKRISLTLQAPDIASLTTFKLSYSVSYSYSGTRSAVIPVVDGITRTKPLGKFSESKSSYSPDTNMPSYGPVQLSYKPPVGGTMKIGSQVTNEYWGVNNQPFRLELSLAHVGTVEGSQPVRLRSISLTASNNLVATPGVSNSFCPINNNVNDRLKAEKDLVVGPRSVPDITSKPTTLSCQFIPNIGNAPESNVEVKTVFEYDYIFQRSETFTVQPFEQKR